MAVEHISIIEQVAQWFVMIAFVTPNRTLVYYVHYVEVPQYPNIFIGEKESRYRHLCDGELTWLQWLMVKKWHAIETVRWFA